MTQVSNKSLKQIKQRKHAIKRANERFFVNLDDSDLDDMCHLIYKKEYTVLHENFYTIVCKLDHDKLPDNAIVVFDTLSREITTFITDEMDAENKKALETTKEPEGKCITDRDFDKATALIIKNNSLAYKIYTDLKISDEFA